MSYAEYEFTGIAPHSKGGTQKQHIEALKKMGAPIPESPVPTIPTETAYLLNCYKTIRFTRHQKDGTSVLIPREVLNWDTIEAYSKLSGLELAPWEIETIMNIDGIFEQARAG